jgi:hypothetical protein
MAVIELETLKAWLADFDAMAPYRVRPEFDSDKQIKELLQSAQESSTLSRRSLQST